MLYGLIAIVGILLILRLLERVYAKRMLHVAKNPTVGFVNIGGIKYAELLREDHAALKYFFSKSVFSEGDAPRCDVLFLYTELFADGCVAGPEDNLRDLATRANARLLVLASSSPYEHVQAAVKKEGPRDAGIVVTINRNGVAFPNFFSRLFRLMREGKTITHAWTELTPQIPARESPDLTFGIGRTVLAFTRDSDGA